MLKIAYKKGEIDMKKIISVVVCIILAAAVALNASAAGLDASKQKIMDALKSSFKVDGKIVSLPDDILTQAENYLKRDDVTITASQADSIVRQVNEAAEIVKAAGATKIADLKAADKTAILGKIQKAAEVVNLTVAVDSSKNVISILSGDQLVATDEAALKVTGPNPASLIIFAGIGLFLLTGCFVAARKAKLFER